MLNPASIGSSHWIVFLTVKVPLLTRLWFPNSVRFHITHTVYKDTNEV